MNPKLGQVCEVGMQPVGAPRCPWVRDLKACDERIGCAVVIHRHLLLFIFSDANCCLEKIPDHCCPPAYERRCAALKTLRSAGQPPAFDQLPFEEPHTVVNVVSATKPKQRPRFHLCSVIGKSFAPPPSKRFECQSLSRSHCGINRNCRWCDGGGTQTDGPRRGRTPETTSSSAAARSTSPARGW